MARLGRIFDKPYRQAEDLIEEARASWWIVNLDLSNLGTTEIPESIGKLTWIQIVNLSKKPTDSFPKLLKQTNGVEIS